MEGAARALTENHQGLVDFKAVHVFPQLFGDSTVSSHAHPAIADAAAYPPDAAKCAVTSGDDAKASDPDEADQSDKAIVDLAAKGVDTDGLRIESSKAYAERTSRWLREAQCMLRQMRFCFIDVYAAHRKRAYHALFFLPVAGTHRVC